MSSDSGIAHAAHALLVGSLASELKALASNIIHEKDTHPGLDMRLFKASGATYRSVAAQSLHAFPYPPKDLSRGELVLLSKNRADCAMLERQVQFVAKVVGARDADAEEIERHFPRVNGGERWRTLVRLHWSHRLDVPFNLAEVRGLEVERYETAQNFAKIDAPDEQLIVDHLIKSNPAIVLSFLDSPAPPDADDWDHT